MKMKQNPFFFLYSHEKKTKRYSCKKLFFSIFEKCRFSHNAAQIMTMINEVQQNGMCYVHWMAWCTFMFVIVFWHAIKLVFNLECSSLNATLFVLVFFITWAACAIAVSSCSCFHSYGWISKQSSAKRISFIFVWMCDVQLMLQWFLYV